MMMIERMARAICPEGWSDTNDSGLSEKDAEAHTQIIRRWACAKARAALTTLLEPSDDMIEAGRDAVRDSAYYSDLAAYCGAIQAALDEKEG